MDLSLFLITIFSLPLITRTQPFIDCSGKSFLCENSTHFTICVDVGGGVSMTVGNIVLSCPPTTFCDENNAFECEYRTSTSTSPSLISQDTIMPTETTEVRLTTNVYDEFFFTSDSQQAEENVVFPTQQKYIIPGNANVIFDDTDNAVLVYGNIDSETVINTPVTEKITKITNRPITDNINALKNKNTNVNKKFTRRNKEPTPKFEGTRNNLSTTIAQTTDTTDKITTAYNDIITEEFSAVEYVPATKNIKISVTPTISVPDIGSNHNDMANYMSSSRNKSENTARNNKHLGSIRNSTVNKLGYNEISPKTIARSNSNFSDAVSNASLSVNVTRTDKIIKDKAIETLQQNKNNQTHLENNPLIYKKSTKTLQSITESAATLDVHTATERYAQKSTSKYIYTLSADVTETPPITPDASIKTNVKTPLEKYPQNDTFWKNIIPSNSTGHNKTIHRPPTVLVDKNGKNTMHSKDVTVNSPAHLNKTISTTPGERVIVNLNIPTVSYDENYASSKDITSTKSTEHSIEPIPTTPSLIKDRYPQNATPISRSIPKFANNSMHIFEPILTKSKESYVRNANLSKDITPLNSPRQQIKTISALPNKTMKSNLSTPPIRYAQNVTVSKDVSSSTLTNPISTTPIEIVTSTLYTSTDTYAQNGMYSRSIILPDSLDYNSGSNSFKTTLRNKQSSGNENTILFDDLVRPTIKTKNLTPISSTTTKPYTLNIEMSNSNIPPESTEFDITFGDILKVNKDTTDLKIPKKVYFTEKAMSESTVTLRDTGNPRDSIHTSHDNDFRVKLSDYINSFNFDGRKSTGKDTITDKDLQSKNNEISTDAITAVNTETITDKIILGMNNLNNELHSNSETITEFTTEALQDINNYQTTLINTGLGDIKNTLFEDTDYSILLYPASTIETLFTEMSTTPKTYIQNGIIANPIFPNDSPDFDISFGDLIKGNKDFIEMKSPLQMSFTDRPISDFADRSENRESLRNFRSTSNDTSLNNDLASNPSANLTKHDFVILNTTETTSNTSIINVTVTDSFIVQNEAADGANKSLNKDLILNNTNTTSNHTPQFPNTNNGVNTTILHEEMIEEIRSKDETSRPRYSLNNNTLNATIENMEEKNNTKSNKATSEAIYVSEVDKSISDKAPKDNDGTIIRTNVNAENHIDLNKDDIKEVEIIENSTSNTNDMLKHSKIMKPINTELISNKTDVSMYSTQIPSVPSYYSTNTESITMTDYKSEKIGINPIKNKTDLVESVMLENKMTEVTRDYQSNVNKAILNRSNTLSHNVFLEEATTSNTATSKNETSGMNDKAYMTEGPILHSLTVLDSTENKPAILFNGNTEYGPNNSISYKELAEKIQKADKIIRPNYNLSNQILNITVVSIAEKERTKVNESDDNATYLTVSRKEIMDKVPILMIKQENVSTESYLNLNDKGNGGMEITDTPASILDDKGNDIKKIKRTDNEVPNDTLDVLNFSTQSPLDNSYHLTNTEGITVNYEQNKTINSLNNNTVDFLQSKTRNNGDIVNKNSVVTTAQNATEPVLITNNSTRVDLTKEAALTTESIANFVTTNDDTESITEDKYMTEVPLLNASRNFNKVAEYQLYTEKNVERPNNSILYNTDNNSERPLQTPTTTPVGSILNDDTFTGVIKNYETASTLSMSINNVEQTTDFTNSPTVSTYLSFMKNNKQNRQENQIIMNDKRKENLNKFTSTDSENVTRPSIKQPLLTTDPVDVQAKEDIVNSNATSNNNQVQSTKHNLTDISTAAFTIPLSTMTTENLYLITKSENPEITSESLYNNKAIPMTKTPIYEIDVKKISDKKKYQNTLYDAFVNSINKDTNPDLQISTSADRNVGKTTLRLENKEENVTENNTQQINYNGSTNSSNKFSDTVDSLKPNNSTIIASNKANNSITNTSQVFKNNDTYEALHSNELVINLVGSNTNNTTVNKLDQQNVTSRRFLDLSHEESIGRPELKSIERDIATNTQESIVKENNDIKVDKETKLSQVIESKNEPIIQKCANRSICISQGSGQVAIELYNKTRINISLRNKTDSVAKEMIVPSTHNDQVFNTTTINVSNIEFGAHNKTLTKTKRFNDGSIPLITTDLNKNFVEMKHINNTVVQNNTESLKKIKVSYTNNNSADFIKGVQEIYNVTTKNHELKRQIQNNSHINVTILPVITTKNKEYVIVNKNETPIHHIQTTKSPLTLQNRDLKSRETISKTNIATPKTVLTFNCRNRSRGRYADKDNCRKFYICIGYSTPIVGFCPESTVFSEFKKQCTNNLSHCIRNNQFKCVKDGRFIDVWQNNMYYLCVKGPNRRFLRLKLECKKGYTLDKVNVMCKQGEKVQKLSSSTSANSSSSSSSSSDKKKKRSNKKPSSDTGFKCNEEGKFVDPNNCRKYYTCTKTSKAVLRRKRKKCDSDEVFDDDKKKCVDEDSYECK